MENDGKPAGFSASELVQISSRAGVAVNTILVTDWSHLPIPAILHLTSEHYVIVREKRGDFYKVNDPLLGQTHWITLPEVQAEASGCAIIPQNLVGAVGTRVLLPNEADQFHGRCHAGEPIDIDDPGPGDDFVDIPPGGYGGYPTSCCGMATIHVTEPGLNPWVVDIPLKYKPPYGPEVELKIARKSRQYDSPVSGFIRFGASVGRYINASWTMYAELDNYEASALAVLPSGARALFDFTGANLTSDVNYKFNLTLEKVVSGGSVIALKLHSTKGETLEFAQTESSTYATIYHITKQYDKASNYTTFQYGTNCLVTNVIAADGVSFAVQYNYSGHPEFITDVVASYGATVQLGYAEVIDTEMTPYYDQLSRITDPVGINSRFRYETRENFQKVITPYGETEVVEGMGIGGPTTGIFNRTLRLNYADGTSEFWGLMNEYENTAWAAVSSGNIPSGTPPGTLDTSALSERNTFHWTPAQWNPSWDLTITNDYNAVAFSNARVRHWLSKNYPGSTHFDTLSWERSPSTDGGATESQARFYDYAGKIYDIEIGTQIKPAEISGVMPDGTTYYKIASRNSLGKPTLEIEKWVDGGAAHYRTNSYTYSADGIDLLEHRFDPDGVNRLGVGYGYDVSHPHLPVRITNALNEITVNTYDTSHRLVTTTTPAGHVISNSFGGDGFVSKTVEYEASIGPVRTNQFTWINGLLSTLTDARGMTISNSWDYLNRPTRVDFPDGTYIGYAYTNGAGTMLLDKTYEVDRLGNAQRYEFDSRQRMVRQYDSLNRVTAYGFCTCGAVNYITNAYGSGVQEVTHYVFDEHRKITETYYPDGNAMTNKYDALDRLIVVSDALGSMTNTYDNLNRLVAVSNYFGRVSFTVYDDQDRVYSQMDANGVCVTNTYDDLGRILTRIHPDGGVETWAYTANITAATSYTDQLSKVTTNAFDKLGRKTLEVIVGVMTNSFTYGPADDLLTLSDGLSQTTTWGVNLYGQKVSKKYANGTTNLTFAFDANGRLTNRWSGAFGNTKYSYDAVGNLTAIDYPTSPDSSFNYDDLNRLTRDVRTGQFTNVYTYAAGGALFTEDGPWPNDTVTNSYNTARFRSAMTIEQPTSQFTNGYSYDAAHRLSALTSHSGSFTYDYFPTNAGVTASTRLIRKLTLPPGRYITNSFDNEAQRTETRLMTSADVELNDHAYVYNQGHQRTQQTRTDDSYVTYSYDDAGELRTAYTTNSVGSEVASERYMFGYDAAWNMINRTNNASVTSYTVNNLNENTSSYSYDVNGNATANSSSTETYAYDDENRLATVTHGTTFKTDFQYDARGRLHKRIDYSWTGSTWLPNTETRYVFDGMLVIQERNSSNVPQFTYTRGTDLSDSIAGAGGIGGLLCRAGSYLSGSGTWTNNLYYHADANGNITYLMQTNETSGATYKYDPFGRTITSSGTYASANRYRFSSKEIYSNTGFYFYGQRFYAPNSQRWLNRDPEHEKDGFNLYTFIRNQPTDNIDPTGTVTLTLAQVMFKAIGFRPAGIREEITPCIMTCLLWKESNFRTHVKAPPPSTAEGIAQINNLTANDIQDRIARQFVRGFDFWPMPPGGRLINYRQNPDISILAA